MKDIDFIRENTLHEDLLCQLAEECCETAQASLKLKRAIEKTNPTPVSEERAEENLSEEIRDVILVLDILGYVNLGDDFLRDPWIAEKTARWVKRLKEAR